MRLVVERGTPLAELRDDIEAAEVPLERIVVRPGPTAAEEDEAELVMAKGSREEEVLSLIDGLRRVSGGREPGLFTKGVEEREPSPLWAGCPKLDRS